LQLLQNGMHTKWPHDSCTGWSYCVFIPSWVVLPEAKAADGSFVNPIVVQHCCSPFCPLYWEICHFLANQVLKIGSCKSKQASVSLLFDFGSYVWDGSFSGCKWVFSPLMALVHWGEYFEDSVISWSFLLQWVFATP
jgi:hypothetical protein